MTSDNCTCLRKMQCIEYMLLERFYWHAFSITSQCLVVKNTAKSKFFTRHVDYLVQPSAVLLVNVYGDGFLKSGRSLHYAERTHPPLILGSSERYRQISSRIQRVSSTGALDWPAGTLPLRLPGRDGPPFWESTSSWAGWRGCHHLCGVA